MASPTAQISRTSRFDMRGRRLANLPTDALGRPINNTNANAYTQSGYRTGVMNQTDGQNAGFAAQPWAPSSGVGPGTRGYRGSFDGGYGSGYGHYRGASRSGSGEEGFKTKRPTASTSDEYYANRDAVIGNPLTMLKANGPGRFNILDRVRAESQGGMKMRTNADGSVSGMPDIEGGTTGGASGPPNIISGMEHRDQDHSTSIGTDGRSRLISRWGEGSNVPVEAPKPADLGPDPLRIWKTQSIGPSKDLMTGFDVEESDSGSGGPAGPVGPPSPSILSSLISKRNGGAPAPRGRYASRVGEVADVVTEPIGAAARTAISGTRHGVRTIAQGGRNILDYFFKPRLIPYN